MHPPANESRRPRFYAGCLTSITLAAALASGAALAQYPPPGTPADAHCREVAQARIFSEPNPEGLALQELGFRIWKKCLGDERAAARAAPTKVTPAATVTPPAAATVPATVAAPGATAPAAATPLGTVAFREAAMQVDALEIESSRIALARSRNGAVRAFARRMIADHTTMSQALNGGVAVSSGASGGPAASGAATPAAGVALDPRNAALVNDLSAVPSGARFDASYGAMQRQAHQQAVAMFAAYAQGGYYPPLQSFAAQALPYLERHLALARRLPGASR
jgi:putative membrane protein